MLNCEILVQNGSSIYAPIIEEGIEWETERKNAPGKLTFKILKDNILNITEGNAVRLTANGTNVFYGFIFDEKRDKGRNNHNNSV